VKVITKSNRIAINRVDALGLIDDFGRRCIWENLVTLNRRFVEWLQSVALLICIFLKFISISCGSDCN